MDKVENQLRVEVAKNALTDEGDGVVSFPNGLTITDNSEQRNGTRYDINSLDISKYGGQLTGDHRDELGNLIGETIGTVKLNGKVVVNKIRYAIKENPYARLAYNLLVGGFSKNFSTETLGPPPDADGIYWNAELVGLSQVVTQNNYNAHVNQVIHNSLEQSKNDGLDVTGIEDKVLNHVEDEKTMEENTEETQVVDTPAEETKTEEAQVETTTVEETKVEEVKEEAPVEETTETKTEEAPVEAKTEETTEVEAPKEATSEATVEVKEEAVVTVKAEAPVEEEKTETETEENSAEETQTEAVTEEQKETNNKETEMTDEKDTTVENSVSVDAIQEAVANALKPLAEELASVKEAQKNAFDASAQEPQFKTDENAVEEKAENKWETMGWEERYNAQIQAAWNAVKLNDHKAQQDLREINEVNLNALKEKGIAKNAMTLEELGNFVISPELYDEIVGHRNDYSALIEATEWKETMSLEFAWLKRTGDIDMQNVSIGVNGDAPGNDDRLKPVSEYSATPQTSKLEELAAVTVVATSATRFAAVDLLSDAAAGYRNDYDRKRAQLVIAKLEQAIDSNQKSVGYNPASDVEGLTVWLDAITQISDTTLNGVLVFNARSFAELKSRAIKAGANGPLSEILTTGDVPTVFGYRFVVVPNDLMPSLGGTESVSHDVEGTAVPINHAVYFADLSTFTGRTSGGLQYDVSNSAAYESGGSVKSAYQRNELVLRGSFFRGGAIKDEDVVAGIRQDDNANVS